MIFDKENYLFDFLFIPLKKLWLKFLSPSKNSDCFTAATPCSFEWFIFKDALLVSSKFSKQLHDDHRLGLMTFSTGDKSLAKELAFYDWLNRKGWQSLRFALLRRLCELVSSPTSRTLWLKNLLFLQFNLNIKNQAEKKNVQASWAWKQLKFFQHAFDIEMQNTTNCDLYPGETIKITYRGDAKSCEG